MSMRMQNVKKNRCFAPENPNKKDKNRAESPVLPAGKSKENRKSWGASHAEAKIGMFSGIWRHWGGLGICGELAKYREVAEVCGRVAWREPVPEPFWFVMSLTGQGRRRAPSDNAIPHAATSVVIANTIVYPTPV